MNKLYTITNTIALWKTISFYVSKNIHSRSEPNDLKLLPEYFGRMRQDIFFPMELYIQTFFEVLIDRPV